MKVLFVCTELAPGMIPYASAIVNMLAKDPDNEIYAITTSKKEVHYKFIPNVRHVEYDLPQNKFMRILYKLYPVALYNEINRVCDKYAIEIIHFLTIEFILTPFIKKLIKRYTVVYTVHDAVPHDSHIRLSWNYLYNRYVIIANNQKNIKRTQIQITNSKEQFNYLQVIYPEKKIFFHPFPSLITPAIQTGHKECPEIKDIEGYILFFGYLSKRKGIDNLYKAYTESNLWKKYHLVIAGKGEVPIERINEKEQKLHFINRFIDEEEMKMLYKKAACVVYPYTSITQSGVISLAFYFQTPVIATNLPFFTNLIDEGKTGIIVPAHHNTEALIKAIEQLMNDPNKQQFIRNEQKTAYNQHYSDKAIAKKINQIYNQIP